MENAAYDCTSSCGLKVVVVVPVHLHVQWCKDVLQWGVEEEEEERFALSRDLGRKGLPNDLSKPHCLNPTA